MAVTDILAVDLLLGGRYRLERELARSATASRWEAADEVLGRRVAVKVLHPYPGADATLRERFRREATAVARLNHPALVSVFDTGEHGDLAYVVMEHVDGIPLRRLLDEHGPLPIHEATDIAVQVADGLDTAHQWGVVHGDVTPSNIVVLPDGRTKLAGFGIVPAGAHRPTDDDPTQPGAADVATTYLAPEQADGRTADARTDVYGLGLVLSEMLCGRAGGPLRPRQVRADVPRALEAVVLRATARRPEQRFASAGDLRAALLAAREPEGDRTPVAGIGLPPARDRRFTLEVVALVALSVAVAVGGALLAGTDAGRSVLENVRERFGTEGSDRLEVAGARDFDPFGDGEESPGRVALVHDGDPDTTWHTDRYRSRAFGNLKAGVGIRLDLEGHRRLGHAVVVTRQVGWAAELYVGDGTAESLDEWGPPVVRGERLGPEAEFDLGGAEGRSLLLWLTLLPESGQLEIGEVQVFA